jgi:short-subunit dehydrogenase
MPNSLREKTIVLTGATGGIGQALCDVLAEHGCRLGLLGRNAEKLDLLAVRLRRLGVDVCWQSADVRDRAALHAAIGALATRFGEIDVLIHNAGVGRLTDPLRPNVDDTEELMAVNYLAGVHAIAAVLPSMLARGRGHLVVISSLSALVGLPRSAGYSASKAAIATFLESLRPDLRRHGVAATTCYFGFVRTAMTESLPLNSLVGMLTPEYTARRIVQAIVHQRRETYFPWHQAWLLRVARCLPAWAFDAVMARVGQWTIQGD